MFGFLKKWLYGEELEECTLGEATEEARQFVLRQFNMECGQLVKFDKGLHDWVLVFEKAVAKVAIDGEEVTMVDVSHGFALERASISPFSGIDKVSFSQTKN